MIYSLDIDLLGPIVVVLNPQLSDTCVDVFRDLVVIAEHEAVLA